MPMDAEQLKGAQCAGWFSKHIHTAQNSGDQWKLQACESLEKYKIYSLTTIDQLTDNDPWVRLAAAKEVIWWGIEYEEFFARIFGQHVLKNMRKDWAKYYILLE